ncbi:MAG: DnaJ domain-containing protein [Gammaproteobacteria bacterium]|nr:DnaJ domain-containing protein [Gammaproteobacteria bacterium]
MFPFDLSQAIENYILENTSCKEFEIIQYLQANTLLPKNCLAQPLSLFRSHFLVFNALYRLQIKLHLEQRYALSISPLEIRLEPFKDSSMDSETEKNMAFFDEISLFYLDIKHLNQTDESDVNTLLDHFWQHYFNNDQKQNALQVLGLSDPVDFKQIKQQYRRLAMQHHPDRGGDSDKLIEIHQAMQCLQHYYPSSA